MKCIAIRTGIDDKEKVARFDLATLLIGNPIDIATDTRTQLYSRDRTDTTIEFVPCLHGTRQHARNRDIGRGRLDRSAGSRIACGKEGCRENNENSRNKVSEKHVSGKKKVDPVFFDGF
jgi:hypothetical protein